MNICFYTDSHLGDILLSNPFVHKICNSNPEKDFFQWCLYGNELLMGPSNLTYLDISIDNEYEPGFTSGDSPENYTENSDLKQMFIRNHHTDIFIFKYKNIEYIAFNIWCISLGCSDDVKYDELCNGFDTKIKKINQIFNTTYLMNSFEHFEMLPYLKPKYNNNFIQWYKINCYKKNIFFYNFVPRLGESRLNMSLFLQHATTNFPDYNFIVSMYVDTLKDITNIVFCDRDFGINPVKDGTNLLYLAEINNKCNIIISSFAGASWVWFNRNIEINQKKILLFDDCDNFTDNIKTYIPKLNNWYRESSKKDKDVIFYLNNNIDVAIQTFASF